MILFYSSRAVIVQIFIPIAELVIHTGTPINEAVVEVETSSNSRGVKKKMLKVIQRLTCLFMLFGHHIIMFYFLKIISCFIIFLVYNQGLHFLLPYLFLRYLMYYHVIL